MSARTESIISPNDMAPGEIHNKNILYGVLNWGLGHATRSVPLIRQLLAQGNKVTLASDGLAKEWLTREFPDLEVLGLPEYDIRYSSTLPMAVKIGLQLPRLYGEMKKEADKLGKWQDSRQFDLVISDNRPGLWSKSIHSVYISHQLKVKAGAFSSIATWMHKRAYDKFDELWVPDTPENLLSGELSESQEKAVTYIGPLSRMNPGKITPPGSFSNALVVISGPEPSRTRFEEQLAQLIRNHPSWHFTVVRGTTSVRTIAYEPEVAVHDLLDSDSLGGMMENTDLIICRSGYSSIMDLHVLQKPALMIPTSGQAEQEYLAKHLRKHERFVFCDEKELGMFSLGNIFPGQGVSQLA